MLVRETSLFITTCHSILTENNVSTVLCGRSGFTWSCSSCTSQEVCHFFLGRGKKHLSEGKKRASAMLPEVCAWRNTSGHCSRKASDCNHDQSHELSAIWMENRQGHHHVLPRAVLLFHQTAYSLWVSLARVPGWAMGRAVAGDVTTVHSPSSCVGVYLWSWNFCLTVQKSGRIFRLSHQPRRPWRAVGS